MGPSSVVVKVLGPLEVRGRGAVQRPNGRVRDLLALMVASRPAWVGSDELQDRLWSGSPPPSSDSALRTYVSRLRTLLGREVIEGSGQSWRIVPGTITTDLDQVRAIAQSARRNRAGDPAAAAADLRDALAEFTGVPYMDVACLGIEPDRSAAEQLRLTIEDEWADLVVEAGTSADHLEELAALVRAQPLREHRTGTLMRALHLAGRRTEALRVFQELYRLLSTELGLRPSAALVALEQSMLLDRPGRATEGSPSQPHHPPVPRTSASTAAERSFGTEPDFHSIWAEAPDTVIISAAALIDRNVDVAVLSHVLGMGASRLADAIDVAVRAGTLLDDGGLRFRDEAARAEAVQALRTRDRLRLTDALAHCPVLPSWRRVHHAVASGRSLPDLVEPTLAAATEAMDAQVPSEAVALLNEVLDLLGHTSERGAHLVSDTQRVQLRRLAMTASELSGDPGSARRTRAELFDEALRAHDVRSAAELLLDGVPTGRSYLADPEFSSMIRRCLAAWPRPPSETAPDPVVARLEAELVCREVLDAGPCKELLDTEQRMRGSLSRLHDPAARSAVRRALLHIDMVRGAPLDQGAISALLLDARDCGALDDESDGLALLVRAAIEAGDLQAWYDVFDLASELCVRSGRPVELWSREVLRATDSQLRGHLRLAREQADEARRIARRHQVSDADISWSSHVLASFMQRGTNASSERLLLDVADTPINGLARLLVGARRGHIRAGAPDVVALVELVTATMASPHRGLTALPATVISAQIVWELADRGSAASLLGALEGCTAKMIIAGLSPVACFGPTDRFRALLLSLLGDHAAASDAFARAAATARAMRATGWEAAIAEDEATMFDRAGNPQEAARFRALAGQLRGGIAARPAGSPGGSSRVR